MLRCTGFSENPQRGEAASFHVIEEGLDLLASASEKYVELSQLYKPTEQILRMVSKGEVFHPIGG